MPCRAPGLSPKRKGGGESLAASPIHRSKQLEIAGAYLALRYLTQFLPSFST